MDGDTISHAMRLMIEELYDANNLYNAFLKAKQGTDWKPMVQNYEANVLINIYNTQQSLMKWTYEPKSMHEFVLYERGHTRLIKAQDIFDRVIQRSFNDNILVPKTRPRLIYDNGASLSNKGLSFARKRFEIHLRKAYQEYGPEAYILLMDFSKYYDNILHDEAISQFKPLLTKEELQFLKLTFKQFEAVVDDPEYLHTLYNSLTDSGSKYTIPKSIGIGNQSSQITGVFYAHKLDEYCKTVKGIKYYGRYMDDTYIILPNKQEAHKLMRELDNQCLLLGIHINYKKTKVSRITQWITWLKINYKLKPTGGLVRKVHGKTFVRERRRLLKFYRLLYEGKMSFPRIQSCYLSWRGTYKKYDSKTKLRKMDRYFNKLFKEWM